MDLAWKEEWRKKDKSFIYLAFNITNVSSFDSFMYKEKPLRNLTALDND